MYLCGQKTKTHNTHKGMKNSKETQLVRLDPPYNIICNERGDFALHIATLMVIDPSGTTSEATAEPRASVYCYPVVQDRLRPGGIVWKDALTEDYYDGNYMLFCREKEGVSLMDIKQIIEWLSDDRSHEPIEAHPFNVSIALHQYGIRLYLPQDEKGQTIHDFEVELRFDFLESNVVDIYSSYVSAFYLHTIYDIKAEEASKWRKAIEKLRRQRDAYAIALDGVEKITFTTKQKKYKSFVDKLNAV